MLPELAFVSSKAKEAGSAEAREQCSHALQQLVQALASEQQPPLQARADAGVML